MNSYGSHVLEGQRAWGVPHVSGRGASAVRSAGMFCRGKKNTRMPVLSQSTKRAILVHSDGAQASEHTGVDSATIIVERSTIVVRSRGTKAASLYSAHHQQSNAKSQEKPRTDSVSCRIGVTV